VTGVTAFILDSQPPCTVSGRCQLGKAAEQLAQAEQLVRQARAIAMEGKMNQALWCDSGGHAFSARDPGRQEIMINVLADDGETEVQDARTMCGQCAEKAGLLRNRVTNVLRKRLPGRADPVHIAELENELGVGNGGG